MRDFIIPGAMRIAAACALLALLGSVMPAADQVIVGDPLVITASDLMRMDVTRKQPDGNGGFTQARQYYSGYFPFLSLTSQADGAVMYSSYGSSINNFVAVANSKPDPWTIQTSVTAADQVAISQIVSYTQGTQIYRHVWTVTNNGATTYSDSSFRYGGDTYFSGSDEANGFHNSDLGMVYCTNSSFAGLMGMFGGTESPATHYYEGGYSSAWTYLGTPGTNLLDTFDPSFIDNGMGLEWVHGTFAPGDSFTIVAYEKWTDAGFVQVLAPQSQDVSVGDRIDLVFTVQNLRSAQDTVSFAIAADQGLAATAPAPVVLAANSSASVTIGVDVGPAAAGRTVSLALQATSGTDGISTADGARLVVAAASPVTLPSIPLSDRGRTIFGAICPSTPEGADRLLAALAGRSDTIAACYAWDAGRQAYVKLPDQPDGGLLASSGAFLATRVDLGLDFAGTPTVTPADLELLPGWNLIGIPLLDDDGPLLATHEFPADFELTDGDGAVISDPTQFADTLGVVGSGDPETARPWLYDGESYAQTGELVTGVGYWIKNNTDAAVTLRRLSAGQADAVRPTARSAVRATAYHDRGAPPAAPAAADGRADGGGGCGGGSGIACLLAFGWLVLRRRAA